MQARMICVLGVVVFILIAWLVSENRTQISNSRGCRRFVFAVLTCVLVLRTSPGRWVFERIGDGFSAVMETVKSGSGFLFSSGGENPLGDSLLGTFAFGVLPTVIFFSSLMSILYHLGVMQRVVWALAWCMRFTLGTSGPETLAAAANVFAGQTEAPLVIRPYLATMTQSELCAMMVGGFATLSGGLLGVYAGMGIDISHLLTASVISAPAALLIAKVMVPESEPERVTVEMNLAATSNQVNVIGAAVEGASEGLKLVLNVGAMLIAFLALLALVDVILGALCRQLFLVDESGAPQVSLGVILGYVCWPFAWLLGIPANECMESGRLIGLKTVANEFIAYDQLGSLVKSPDSPLSPRTITVLTYALAGFSNFGASVSKSVA